MVQPLQASNINTKFWLIFDIFSTAFFFLRQVSLSTVRYLFKKQAPLGGPLSIFFLNFHPAALWKMRTSRIDGRIFFKGVVRFNDVQPPTSPIFFGVKPTVG